MIIVYVLRGSSIVFALNKDSLRPLALVLEVPVLLRTGTAFGLFSVSPHSDQKGSDVERKDFGGFRGVHVQILLFR